MAQTIACDFCGSEPAALLIGNLVNGEQVAVGSNCAPDALQRLSDTFSTPPVLPMPSVGESDAPSTEDAGAADDAAPRMPTPEGETPDAAGANGALPAWSDGPDAEHARGDDGAQLGAAVARQRPDADG